MHESAESVVGPSVSVVIPHFGDPCPTRDLVRSLLGQVSVDLEVVVVDDCSPTEFSMEPAQGLTVVRRSANGGFGQAVNTGVEAATGELLMVLNSDVSVEGDFVARLLEASRPWMPAVTGPAIVAPSGEVDYTARHFPKVRHQFVEWLVPLARWRGATGLHEAVGHDTRATVGKVVTVDWLVGAALLLPLEDFRAVGGFDDRYYMNSEEVDLQRRLRSRGLPAVYIGTVSLDHEGGGSSPSDRRRRWLVESRHTYALRWGGARRLRAALTAATGINFVWNLGRRALGRQSEPFAAARHEIGLIWGGRRG